MMKIGVYSLKPMKYYIVLPFLCVLLFSCNKNTDVNNGNSKLSDSIQSNNKIVNSVGVLLSKESRDKVKDWKEYQKIDVLISELFNTSKMEALENAADFSQNVKYLRDSIRLDELDNPKIISRLNVLLSESLRLKDMNDIPSISKTEVADEVKKVLNAFSSLNSKINTHYKNMSVEESLEDMGF